MTIRRLSAVYVLGLALLAGCGDYMWWEYRDDPYLADVGAGDEQEALRKVNSISPVERQIALRHLALQAGQARRRGDASAANRIEDVIIRRYYAEKDTAVRAAVVRICAPAVGRGSTRMVEFLLARIAAGEFPGYAALSLAHLAPRAAFEDIEPLTRHPAPEVRYQAATALCILADPRGYEPVARVWRGMRPQAWPNLIEGTPVEEAKIILGRRAEQSFGRPLY